MHCVRLQDQWLVAPMAGNPLISSQRVKGTNVYGPADAKVGEIEALMIDKISGRVRYAVMSFGGFLGIGHSHFPIPWPALKYDPNIGGYRTGITEDQLKAAPSNADWNREWETRVHGHYNAEPYWATGVM